MFDVAIMATGTIESMFDILAANNKSITDIPHNNDVYKVPATAATDPDTLAMLAELGFGTGTGQQKLATGDDPTLYIGISYWQVGVDFKVS